jgi:choline dehydrogenase
LYVSRGKQANPLFPTFVEAGVQAGYPRTEDMNGFQQEGFGMMDMTIHRGRRWSAANAYLHPAMARPNLTVKTNTLTHRVVFEGTRAAGVEYGSSSNGASGGTQTVAAQREVILCGGAINSPQLLMLSGIGDAAQLGRFGIATKAHLPAVGRNLQDHLDLYLQYTCTKPITLYSDQWRFPHNMVKHGLQWILCGTGKAASAHLESGGFICSRDGLPHPDIQFHFLPGALTGQLTPGSCHAFQAHVSTMRPHSRGFLELQSADPRVPVRIQPNYLEAPEDLVDLRNAVKLTREVFAQQAFDAYRGAPISPAADVQTDAQIDTWIRAHTESAYHPCCTVRMGSKDQPDAVVNSSGEVLSGIKALRVIDASIMPSMISGNLNAPTIMLAEKLADAVRGRPPLPPSDAPVYQRTSLSQR